MREPEPTEREYLAVAAASALAEIGAQDHAERDTLTFGFLREAWPSIRTQNQ